MRDFFAMVRLPSQFTQHIQKIDPSIAYLWLLWLAAAVSYAAGFLGLLYAPTAFVLAAPVGFGMLSAFRFLKGSYSIHKNERVLLILLAVTWMLHALQVFTPETGFDAVWYHLPVARENVLAHRFLYQPDLYQSANPLFSDGLFTLGYLLANDAGTKVIAFMVALGLVGVVFQISQLFVSRQLALATAILVSTFQVIAWQSASFYIDVAVALWLCSGTWYILQWFEKKTQPYLTFAGLLFGAAVASKLFLVALPLPILVSVILAKRWELLKPAVFVSLVAFLVALPAFFFAWIHLGHPLFSVLHHSGIVGEIGSGSTLSMHIAQRLLAVPNAIWQVGISRDYTTPLLLCLLPVFVIAKIKNTLKTQDWVLLSYCSSFLAFWWFVPPQSTRYGLAGFVLGTVFTVSQLASIQKGRQNKLMLVLVVLICAALIPRFIVASRSLQYLAGFKTKQEYVAQFLDGNIDTVLLQWHGSVDLQN